MCTQYAHHTQIHLQVFAGMSSPASFFFFFCLVLLLDLQNTHLLWEYLLLDGVVLATDSKDVIHTL